MCIICIDYLRGQLRILHNKFIKCETQYNSSQHRCYNNMKSQTIKDFSKKIIRKKPLAMNYIYFGQNRAHKKSLSNTSEPSINEKLIQSTKELVIQQFQQFMVKIDSLIDKQKLNRNKILSFLSTLIVFRDIDEVNQDTVNELIGQYTNNKIVKLKKQIQQKDKQINELLFENKNIQYFDEKNLKKKDKVAHSQPTQSQHLLQSNFLKTQNIGSLNIEEKSISINRINTTSSRQKSLLTQNSNENQQINNKYLIEQIFNLSSIKQHNLKMKISQIINKLRCLKPCCKWNDKNQIKLSQQTKIYKKRKDEMYQSHYKNDHMKKYFKFYYKDNFQVNRVKSLIHTETQEMQRLYKSYRTRNKKTSHQRSESIA